MTMDKVRQLESNRRFKAIKFTKKELQDRRLQLEFKQSEIKQCEIGIAGAKKLMEKGKGLVVNKRGQELLAGFEKNKYIFEREAEELNRKIKVLNEILKSDDPAAALTKASMNPKNGIGGIGWTLRPGHRAWSFMYE